MAACGEATAKMKTAVADKPGSRRTGSLLYVFGNGIRVSILASLSLIVALYVAMALMYGNAKAAPFELVSTTVEAPKLLVMHTWYGRFGNNLRSIRVGMAIAKQSDRMFVIPSHTRQGVHLPDIIDFTRFDNCGYKFKFADEDEMRLICDGAKQFEEKSSDAIDIRNLDDRVIAVSASKLFFTCIPDYLNTEILRNTKPTQAYVRAVEHVRSALHLDRYIAIHLRGFENTCMRIMNITFSTERVESLHSMCNITVDTVTRFAEQPLGLRNESGHMLPIYVASDGQNKKKDDSFKNKLNARFLSDALKLKPDPFVESLSPAFIDFFMLFEAEVLIGNPASSFAGTAAKARVAQRGVNKELFSSPLIYPSLTVADFNKCLLFESVCLRKGQMC